MSNDNLNKLSKLFSFFNNRPNHLAKYLIESNAFNKEFLNKVTNVNIPEINDEKMIDIYFVDFNQMNNFFSNLLNKEKYPDLNPEKIEKDLQRELEKCIREERYEDAIRIRDFLKKNIK
jgi:hypothetical protein